MAGFHALPFRGPYLLRHNPAVYVPVRPEPLALPNECFPNVEAKVAIEGGRIQYGWGIWQNGDYFLEAEHHAVYVDPAGQHIDITPNGLRTSKILFVPDDEAVFDTSRTVRRDNVRLALLDDIRLHRYLELAAELHELIEACPKKQRKFVSMSRAQAARIAEIQGQAQWLATDLVTSRRTKR